MTEHFEHNPKDHEDPLTGPTWLIGFIAFVLLNVVFLGLTSLYYSAMDEEEVAKNLTVEPIDLVEIEAEQAAQIERPSRRLRLPDTGETRIVIPIEQAMDLIVEEFGKR